MGRLKFLAKKSKSECCFDIHTELNLQRKEYSDLPDKIMNIEGVEKLYNFGELKYSFTVRMGEVFLSNSDNILKRIQAIIEEHFTCVICRNIFKADDD